MANKGTPSSRNAGGYVEGGRPQKGGGPAMNEGSGPKDKESFNTGRSKGMTQDSYKSPESQNNKSMAGVQDTGSGDIVQLKRSGPNVGVYQSGNNERGGKATGNYDSSTDSDLNISWSQLDDLRSHQDSVKKSHGTKDD